MFARRRTWLILGVVILALGVIAAFFLLRGRSGESIELKQQTDKDGHRYTTLLRDEINRGSNYAKPDDRSAWGTPSDFSRLATTYYHPGSPLGMVLQRFDWFGDFNSRFPSDARMPASLCGLLASDAHSASCPLSLLVGVWSESPIAVLGLNAGTPAAYARPYQHCHFFEPREVIRRLSLPEDGSPAKFSYLQDAMRRGAAIRVFDGDERDTFAATAPDGFYRVLILETARAHPKDPATRLFTKEAFALYLRKLAPDGIICLHTSSRNYGLAPAIADTAYSLDLHCVHANDSDTALKWAPPPKYSISDWVMVARRREVLAQLTVPGFGNPDETTRAAYWRIPAQLDRHILTDADVSALDALKLDEGPSRR